MLRRTPLFQALDRTLVSSGLQPDLHPLHQLLWESAANVTFQNGKVRRRVAAANVMNATGAQPIRGLSQQQATNGTRWLWFAEGSDIYRWYGPAPEKIIDDLPGYNANEGFTQLASFVDFTHYGDFTIISNGSGDVKVHKPGVGVGPLGDCPQNVAFMLKKLNFMMAFGYGARGTRIGWSDADNIESWTASETNLAGALTIDDFDTRIKAGKALGSSIAVYNEDQMALVNYIGGTSIFGFKTALDGIGASGKFSVASDGKSHFGVGRGGIWWTDGLSYKYIDEGYLHDYLQSNVNWAQQSKITAVRNDYTGCFEFSFPMGAALEPSEAWSFDPRTGGWSPIPAFSIKDERRLFQKPILGTSNGRVQRDEDDVDARADGSLVSKPLLMQNEGLTSVHVASKIDEVVLLFREQDGLQFRIGSAHDLGDEFRWGEWFTVTGGTKTYLMGEEQPDGVYHKLEVRSIIDDWKMDLQGFMLFGSIEGGKRDVA